MTIDNSSEVFMNCNLPSRDGDICRPVVRPCAGFVIVDSISGNHDRLVSVAAINPSGTPALRIIQSAAGYFGSEAQPVRVHHPKHAREAPVTSIKLLKRT